MPTEENIFAAIVRLLSAHANCDENMNRIPIVIPRVSC